MKCKNLIQLIPFLLILFLPLISISQNFELTPEKQIKLLSQDIAVPEKFKKNLLQNYRVNVPKGYKTSIFYVGRLSKPRFITFSPLGVLHVANMNSGEIIALPDFDHDLIADTAIVVASNAFAHDVKFYNKAMYVAEELKVEKFTDEDENGIFETRTTFIDSILPGKQRIPGGHTTRTIIIDSLKQKIYLSVGSSCNVCRENGRAVIFEYDINGKNKKKFSSGTRNSVGMDIHPKTGELWVTNNGSDHQGENIPPEWIDAVKEGSFYGYPFAYANKVYFDFNAHEDYQKLLPINKEDSNLVSRMKEPAALVQAHSAPMAIKFTPPSVKRKFRNGALIAYRGSYDRKKATGYKIVFLNFNRKNKVTSVSDFLTGFLTDEVNNMHWARPVGIAIDVKGNIYLSSDDVNQFILVLSPKTKKNHLSKT